MGCVSSSPSREADACRKDDGKAMPPDATPAPEPLTGQRLADVPGAQTQGFQQVPQQQQQQQQLGQPAHALHNHRHPVHPHNKSNNNLHPPNEQLETGLEGMPETGELVVNQYTLTKILGQGSQAQVRLAVDASNNQWAVKIIRKRLTLRRGRARSSGLLASAAAPIAREIAIMKKLQHPNIVQLHEILDLPQHNRIFLVMQYVNGGPIMGDQLEGNKPLEEARARDLFGQLIKGIEYLHFHGIVHRDIKPSNLLVTQTGLLKINDFGVSAICEPVELEDEISDNEDDEDDEYDADSTHVFNGDTDIGNSSDACDDLTRADRSAAFGPGNGALVGLIPAGGSEDERLDDDGEASAPIPEPPPPPLSIGGQRQQQQHEEEMESEKSEKSSLAPSSLQLEVDLPKLTLTTENLESPSMQFHLGDEILNDAISEGLNEEEEDDDGGLYHHERRGLASESQRESRRSEASGLLTMLSQVETPRMGAIPFITPRAAAAAERLNPDSEEMRRLRGILYPPTPSGIEKVQHNDDMNSPPIGTYAFFPPEACNFDNFNDVQYKGKLADLWAAGITLYMMLFGCVPFLADTREGIFKLIRAMPLRFPDTLVSHVSPEAMQLLDRMLAKRSYERLDIPGIKSSDWVRQGAKLAQLSQAYRDFIVPTQDELNAAVTEVDLSVGITPMVRSKSWTTSAFMNALTSPAPERIQPKVVTTTTTSTNDRMNDSDGTAGTTFAASNLSEGTNIPLAAVTPSKTPNSAATAGNSSRFAEQASPSSSRLGRNETGSSIGAGSDGGDMVVPLPDFGLRLDTSMGVRSERPETRPLSLPTRQLRPEPLRQMMERRTDAVTTAKKQNQPSAAPAAPVAPVAPEGLSSASKKP